MRYAYGLIAGSLVLAGAVGAAWSQAPKPIDPNQIKTVTSPAPAAVSDLRVRPTEGIRVSVPVTTVKTLDAGECTSLGGDVKDDKWGVCASGKVCVTVDNAGGYHHVCLSKAQ
jgi:hypothetical protein